MNECPCGTGRAYDGCCGRYISGRETTPTAEALMRSRYSAYVKGEIDYIVNTCVVDEEHGIDEDTTRRWSETSRWLGLRILGKAGGEPGDSTGTVEFAATYEMDGLREEHHEIASFVRKDGSWLYDSGDVVPTTIVRSEPKVGRNDPCPCGSGKKYKKCCCGAA
ncbi:MAG: YchJ family protein [Spirochaetes bacterium]|nr:YchJ family protein [Spirochaetota bacterium]